MIGRRPMAARRDAIEAGKTAPPPPPPMRTGVPRPPARVIPGTNVVLPPDNGVLVLPAGTRLPGDRARRWCYGITAVACAVTMVLTVTTDMPWWPMAVMALLGALFVAVNGTTQRSQEAATALTSELHPDQCDTPGCDCRPVVWDWCAPGDHVVEDGRSMTWTVDGSWACRGCAGADIAPDPGLAELLEAVGRDGTNADNMAALLPLIITAPDPSKVSHIRIER